MSDNLSDIWKLKKRGKRDSQRHEELVKRAIKSKGKDIITEYNIIKTSGNKKVKVPVKFLDKHTFRYGKWNDDTQIGQGIGVEPGKNYKVGDKNKDNGTGQAGDKEGEQVFNAEISIDELVNILLEELNLPWMEPNKSSEVEVINEEVTSIDRKGIFPNLDIKRTLLENIKRNAALGDPHVGDFTNDDLRYKVWEEEKEFISNAAIYIMMDRSGSMDKNKTHIAKSFYFWMVQFLKRRYKNVDLVFIAHDAVAFETSEEEFFTISSDGGTKCSAAFKLALDHIKSHHPPEDWNNYVFEISDGDNFGTDNIRCVELVNELIPLCRAIGYGEILLEDSKYMPWISEDDMLYSIFSKNISRTRFVPIRLRSADDIFDGLKKFFNVDGISKK
jgi:uncharacterized protein